jgi:release factor glutamine methyltransferase
MDLRETLYQGRAYLAQQGLEEASLEAELLLIHFLGISKEYLFSHGEEQVSAAEADAYRGLLDRRTRREPLAYIIKEREFFGQSFYVDERTLIPRPDTETLVEEGLRLADGAGVIADIGTGCGAIAMSLAGRLPQARVYATDISLGALQVASANRSLHGLQEQVHLLWGDLLAPLPEPVDLIVANLPYIPSAVLPTLEPEVSRFEPRLALDGGEDGLEQICRLLQQARFWLRPGGRVLLEVGENQARVVASFAAGQWPGATVRIVRDLGGLERVVVVETVA